MQILNMKFSRVSLRRAVPTTNKQKSLYDLRLSVAKQPRSRERISVEISRFPQKVDQDLIKNRYPKKNGEGRVILIFQRQESLSF